MSEFDHFVGTRAVPTQHAFDAPALQRWLTANLEGFEGPLTAELFQGGQSNPTYKLITPTRSYVMRSKPGPSARLLPSAHAIEREFAVMRALADTDVPVPRMLALCEDEAVIGRAFYVMEFKQGRVLWDQALPGMTAGERAAIYDEMNRVIAALHSVDYRASGLADFGRPGNYFERQIGRWSKQYRASETRPIEAMHRLMEWLPDNIPASASDADLSAIVHGDYRMDNLMFAHDATAVVAVLDWELSTIGHPFADFSYHCMSWHIPSGVFRGIADLDLPALGIPDEQSYIRRYCERTGFASVEQLTADWNFYLAYNMFRLAAILQGIAKRAEQGLASSARAKLQGENAAPLAEMAWRKAQQSSVGR
ncbi:aminoglycoside phosphotransferase [Lampropedia cohaerens]|uniref:Aminoglycoside phosphotransferase n=1 Tax=Lampropedia cohaerens TaxID=1610491 RepID=A0A0U1Q0M7_9BURK|nr:phosphotransferase [Lampropedia cohaerens]KKW68310.1 aminoglycoside phosphotransferase [Lampropedia cohaerens]